MGSPDNKKQWTPILAWVTGLIVNIAALSYFVGVSANTLKTHSEQIANNTLEIKELRRETKIIAENYILLKTYSTSIASIEIKMNKMEQEINSLNKLLVEFEYMKKSISDKQKPN